jgi:hypothetical protein
MRGSALSRAPQEAKRRRHGDLAPIFLAHASTLCKLGLAIYCESACALLSTAHTDISRSMLAVMTLNVGYFLSVLAGLFVGELAIGRYASPIDDHH